jgi:hypothetical protein
VSPSVALDPRLVFRSLPRAVDVDPEQHSTRHELPYRSS